jgi:hypothetical protein
MGKKVTGRCEHEYELNEKDEYICRKCGDITDRCCICGKPATISSEGSSYCHRCAMLHAK